MELINFMPFQNAKNDLKSLILLFITITFLALPAKAWAGIGQPFSLISSTDYPSFQLYFPWDLRGRQSFIQVTNTSDSNVSIHVQIFNHNQNCGRNSLLDTLTLKDTIVYDLSAVQDDPDGFGFAVVTVVGGGGFVLIGNFRIIDDRGYEYRANAAGFPFPPASGFQTNKYTFNFNGVQNANHSDVFGIVVSNAGGSSVSAGGGTAAIFGAGLVIDNKFVDSPVIEFNDSEVGFNCDALAFICGEPNESLFDLLQFVGIDVPSNRVNFEFGINPALPSATAVENVCDAPLTTGFVSLPLTLVTRNNGFFVGFVGLNDGEGTGSMDTWWAQSDSATVIP
jgi:hypothetical protein